MKNTVKIRIELDPINDGIVMNDVEKNTFDKDKDVSGVVLSTNNSLRLLTQKDATKLLLDFGRENVEYFVFGEFVCIYNNDKVFEIDGNSYIAGSVFVLREADDVMNLGQLDDDDIQTIISGIESRMVDLTNGEHTFSAIML